MLSDEPTSQSSLTSPRALCEMLLKFNTNHYQQVEKGPMWQLLFWISFAEIILFPTVIDMDKKDREPGDFSLDPLNLCKVRRAAKCFFLCFSGVLIFFLIILIQNVGRPFPTREKVVFFIGVTRGSRFLLVASHCS